MDETSRSIVVAVNPNSGATDSGAIVEQLVQRLTELGFEPEPISDIVEVRRRSAELRAANRLRAVVAAGGDGNRNLCWPTSWKRGNPNRGAAAGHGKPAGKSFLKISRSVEQVADIIVAGRMVELDAGRANGQLFLVVASCGFDAEVVTRLHAARKGHIRHWSYALPFARSNPSVPLPKKFGSLSTMRRRKLTHSLGVHLSNVPRYAMNLPIATDANAMDGLLDLCTFGVRGLAEGIGALGAVLLRRPPKSFRDQSVAV